jgi:NAD(P)-dependent dehydrogenase (short-subunit alcohol dehydrogenase family)
LPKVRDGVNNVGIFEPKPFEPDEIANVVAFASSSLAAAINGASVRADGGVIKSIA